MPRPILAPICSNSRSRSELSDELKGIIIGRYREGAKVAAIARAESVPYTTVRSLIQRYQERGNTSNAPRSSRPLKYTIYDVRALRRAVRNNPKLTYQALREQAGVNLSKNTIKKVLYDEGLFHWRARDRPELIQQHAAIRLQWAL
jgi:transposase